MNLNRGGNDYESLPGLVSDLVSRAPAVIFATGSVNSVLAAKAATTTIPIVFANGSDPVKFGVVASMNRPGGTVIGVSFYNNALIAKRLELLRELLPTARRLAFLVNWQGLCLRRRGTRQFGSRRHSCRAFGQSLRGAHRASHLSCIL